MTGEIYEQDITWLLQQRPGANEGEQEQFAEKVSRFCMENGHAEFEARWLALALVKGG